MKHHVFTLALMIICCVAGVSNGQRTLDKGEALDILEKLTSQRPTTWLPAGTIEAKHQEFRAAKVTSSAAVDTAIQAEIQAFEAQTDRIAKTEELQKLYLDAIPFNTRYKLANEYSMTSNVTVKYDGKRFYWRIGVTSRSDTVRPSADLTGNYMLERFEVSQNGERTFVWDGQQYIIHSASANHAIVDTANHFQRAVNGPLTAGIVRWGQGALSSSNLNTAEVSATEAIRDGINQIEMTIEPADGSLMVFVLDPSKDYAVTSCTLTRRNDSVTSRYYSGYRQVAGNWVPSTILIENRDFFTNRLLASDKWDLTSIDGSIPGSEQFKVAYRTDTIVEYYSPVSVKASIYHYSNALDTEELLAEHLAYNATKSRGGQNCATAAIKYAAAQQGKSVSGNVLAQMVGSDGQTTMSQLARAARQSGLYCRAVRTDLDTLAQLPACQAILHIPGKNHFVVLDHVDERGAWLVDLSNSTFYYRKDKAFLPMDWSEGTALLLSRTPISGAFDEIDSQTLATLSGGDGWSCTRLLQSEYIDYCVLTEDDCWGAFKWYWERWGCEAAPSGSCSSQGLARYTAVDCIFDPILGCTDAGNWYSAYMLACD